MLANTFLRTSYIISLLSLPGLTGCAQPIEPWVKPYERQHLADPIMRTNRHPIANKHIAHVYDARESSRGADGTGGGGCGLINHTTPFVCLFIWLLFSIPSHAAVLEQDRADVLYHLSLIHI